MAEEPDNRDHREVDPLEDFIAFQWTTHDGEWDRPAATAGGRGCWIVLAVVAAILVLTWLILDARP